MDIKMGCAREILRSMKRGACFLTAHAAVLAIAAFAATAQGLDQKPNWQSIEADNGAIYQFDLNSIAYFDNGSADMVVYSREGADFKPENLRRLLFDCRGRVQDMASVGSSQYAPPRSIAGN